MIQNKLVIRLPNLTKTVVIKAGELCGAVNSALGLLSSVSERVKVSAGELHCRGAGEQDRRGNVSNSRGSRRTYPPSLGPRRSSGNVQLSGTKQE